MNKTMLLQFPLQSEKDHAAQCWAKIRINGAYPLLGSADFHLYDLGGK